MNGNWKVIFTPLSLLVKFMQSYLVMELRFLGLILFGLLVVFQSTPSSVSFSYWIADLQETDYWVGDFKPHQLACSVTHPQSRVIISTFSALIHGACGTLLLVDAAWIHNNNGMMSQLNFNHTIAVTGEEDWFCLPGKVASLGLGRKGTVAFIVILSDPLMGWLGWLIDK